MLTLRNEFSVKAPWFDALTENIREHGLASPLLVINQIAEHTSGAKPMRVKTGQNRLRCLRILGWKHAPCIVVGELPEGLGGIPLKTLAECQAMLGDGIIANEQGKTLRINSACSPEQCRYPKAAVRYFDVD